MKILLLGIILLSLLLVWISNLESPKSSAFDQSNYLCESPSLTIKNSIEGLLKEKNVIIKEWALVRSNDFKRFWFLSGLISKGPYHGSIITFATNTPRNEEGYGLYFSMGDIEYELTGFGMGKDTKSEFSTSDHGWLESRRCLK